MTKHAKLHKYIYGKVEFWRKMAVGAIREKLFFQLFS
jgi:hypothetical protein